MRHKTARCEQMWRPVDYTMLVDPYLTDETDFLAALTFLFEAGKVHLH